MPKDLADIGDMKDMGLIGGDVNRVDGLPKRSERMLPFGDSGGALGMPWLERGVKNLFLLLPTDEAESGGDSSEGSIVLSSVMGRRNETTRG